jgi:alkylation response protein AidB-like acyl-CoA dehydrogenase
MVVKLSKEQREIGELVRELTRGKFAPRATKYDAEAGFPYENFADLRTHGILGLCVPTEYGGMGCGIGGRVSTLYLVLEEIAKGCSSTAQLFQQQSTILGRLELLGNAQQKHRYYRKVLDEGAVFASAGSEAGFDSRQQRSFDAVLKRVNGGYVINGSKHFASAAAAADYYQVWGVLAGASGPADGLLHAFVHKDNPGVSLENDWDTMGMRATVSWSVHFSDCFVEEADVIGWPGQYIQEQHHLKILPSFAANYLGTAGGAFECMTDFVKQRPYLADDPVIQVQIGELRMELDAARVIMYHAARLWESGDHQQAGIVGFEARLIARKTALLVTSRVFDICGGRAVHRKHPLERFFRDARTFTLQSRGDKPLLGLAKVSLGLPVNLSVEG